MVSVVTAVQANSPDVVITALSVKSKKVFITDSLAFNLTSYSDERRPVGKLAPRIHADLREQSFIARGTELCLKVGDERMKKVAYS